MKHWLWINASGAIGGEIVHGNPGTGRGGWDEVDPAIDFNDAESANEEVQAIRASYINNGDLDFDSFFAVDCACPATDLWCDCARLNVLHKRVANGALEDRPVYDTLVDGSPVAIGATVDKAPGTTAALTLSGAVPDGVVVEARFGSGAELLQSSPQLLTFTGGVTNAVTLYVPAQGSRGGISLVPQNAHEAALGGLRVRGFAS